MDSVLVVDSDEQRFQNLKTVLEFIDCDDVKLTSAECWRQSALEPKAYEAIIVADQCTPDLSVLTSDIREWGKTVPILLMSARDKKPRIPSDVIAKIQGRFKSPVKYVELTNTLQRAQLFKANSQKKQDQDSSELFRSLVGNSRGVKQVKKQIDQVSGSLATVLILGESGTGKEVVARNIHYHSARRDKAFVPINCGAIPPDLLESELFGHEKGAFTGAITTRPGRFEMAEGGTLFLDEIGDMSMPMQVKLLRVLQERTFERVGSNKTMKADVRIIAATHKNLETAISDGTFREDLFYRLNVFPIEMPPLRDRKEDVPLLIQELITRIEHQKCGSVRLTQAAIMSLCQYHWPGNVRELANLVERLVIMYPYGVVDVKDLPTKFQPEEGVNDIATSPSVFSETVEITTENMSSPRLPRNGMNLKEHLSHLEFNLIKQALDDSGGVVAHAATRLGLRRTTLVEKLRKYGLQRDQMAT